MEQPHLDTVVARMTIGPIPICASCAHLGPHPRGEGIACAAFPDGIPGAIYMDGYDHRKPFPGDQGVRFELADEPGSERRLAAYELSVVSA